MYREFQGLLILSSLDKISLTYFKFSILEFGYIFSRQSTHESNEMLDLVLMSLAIH